MMLIEWMNKNIVISLAPLMMACGVQRQAARECRPAEPQRVVVNAIPEQAEVMYDVLPEDSPAPTAIPMTEISFIPLEYQHVRVRGMNPALPIDGLKIWLDDLTDDFTYPLQGKFISDYGMRRGRPHTGIDIKAARGDTIRAAFPGVVRMSKLYSSYGNIVVIRHYNGLETVYSHNTRNLVSPDDIVSSGQPIALAGRTGRATTEHLHFEVRAAGEPIDPKLLIDPTTMTLRSGWLFINEKDGKVMAASSVAELESIVSSPDDTAREDALAKSQQQPAEKTTQPEYYIIKRGDVLGGIARKYHTTVSRLCTLNNLKSPDRIREGQRLRVK